MRARARARRDADAAADDDVRARRARRDGDDGWSAAARLREASARGDVAAWTGDDARAFVNARGVDAIAGVGRARAREAATALSRALGATPRAGETTSALTTTTRDERRAPREAVDDGDGDARDAFSGRPGVARGVELDAEAFEGILADASERRDARALYAAQVPMARVGELDVDGTLYDEGFRRFCERHDAQRHCWINGAKRATTNLHYDNYDNVLAVLSGEKRVRLIPPSFCAGGGEAVWVGVRRRRRLEPRVWKTRDGADVAFLHARAGRIHFHSERLVSRSDVGPVYSRGESLVAKRFQRSSRNGAP